MAAKAPTQGQPHLFTFTWGDTLQKTTREKEPVSSVRDRKSSHTALEKDRKDYRGINIPGAKPYCFSQDKPVLERALSTLHTSYDQSYSLTGAGWSLAKMAITCWGTWTPLSGSSQHLGLSEGGVYLRHLLGVIIYNNLCVSGGKPVLGVCFGVSGSRDGLFTASMHASRKHPGRTEGRMVPRQVGTSWNSKASGETK